MIVGDLLSDGENERSYLNGNTRFYRYVFESSRRPSLPPLVSRYVVTSILSVNVEDETMKSHEDKIRESRTYHKL